MLSIDYVERTRRALVSWESCDADSAWLFPLTRLLLNSSEESILEGGLAISTPWWVFTSLRTQIFELASGYGLSLGGDLEVKDSALQLLKQARENSISYEAALEQFGLSEEEIKNGLSGIGFVRQLTPEQLRNVRKTASLPAAASFSVPGAGKTTEALATFFLRSNAADHLLVVAPKNAFGAWDEQLSICMPNAGCKFERLRGGADKIARTLTASPRFMLITYQQLPRVRGLIAEYVSRHPTHIYLDESHRIKSGIEQVTPRAVLDISHLAVAKMILSGTPMPQSQDDLLPQFAFLYPEIPATSENVVERIQPVFVRTTKNELGLPPVSRVLKRIPMNPAQRALYEMMRSEVARQAVTTLKTNSRQQLRALGRSVARLLQFVSNPALLASQIEPVHKKLLAAVLQEGDGPKISYVLDRARELASKKEKILIWTSFVKNVEYIAERLSDLGSVYIHGGVDAGDEEDDESREGKIRLFKDDPAIRVMVANPAAAAEGISLHTVCHHALYLDRTFNAAHYLQSEDRIHRIGLRPDQVTTLEIVECNSSIDQTVRSRLNFKVDQMAAALSDVHLTIDPIPLDPLMIDDPEEYAIGLTPADIEALISEVDEDDE